MNNSANGNMYAYGQQATRDLFGAYLAGNPNGVCAVVARAPLSPDAQDACEKSLHALGYGHDACVFVTLCVAEAETGANASDAAGANDAAAELDASALLALVEGLDPLCIIAADGEAAAALEAAFGQPVIIDAASRVVGRDVVCAASLDALMESAQGKQAAWALFKSLPRYATLNRKKR